MNDFDWLTAMSAARTGEQIDRSSSEKTHRSNTLS